MYTEYCPCNSRQTNVNCVWRLKSLMFFIITPLTEDLLRTTEMFWTSNMFPDKLDDHLILNAASSCSSISNAASSCSSISNVA